MNDGDVLRAKNAMYADRGTYTSAGREIKDLWIVLNEGGAILAVAVEL